MTRIFNPCRRYRAKISLLVSEGLPDAIRISLEQHLSACAACRRYRDEIKMVAGSLRRWEENFASLQLSEAALAHWENDFASALKPNRSSTSRMFGWCKDIIWPSRRIWAGLAVVWTVILALNFPQASEVRTAVAKSVSPSPELVRAFLEGEGFLDRPQTISTEEKGMEQPSPPTPRSERPSGPPSNQTT